MTNHIVEPKQLKTEKAYRNTEFMNSPRARTLRILAEYLEPQDRFKKYKIEDTIVFFGSARITEPEIAQNNLARAQANADQPDANQADAAKNLKAAEVALKMSAYYRDAVEVAKRITHWSQELYEKHGAKSRQFIVCSGGGPGIMEAANRGAVEAGGKSIGLNISLPFEQHPNPYISPELAFDFHYFFIRKFWFAYLGKGLIVFPGGFGTMDEMLEILTLVQTQKIRKKVLPVVLYGSDYWKQIINFDALVDWGMISPEDLNLFHFSDTPEDTFEYIKAKLLPTLEVNL